MRNGRIPNLGNHQMAGEYPKAGDKRPHKLTECEKKKVSATWLGSGAFGKFTKSSKPFLESRIFDLHNT